MLQSLCPSVNGSQKNKINKTIHFGVLTLRNIFLYIININIFLQICDFNLMQFPVPDGLKHLHIIFWPHSLWCFSFWSVTQFLHRKSNHFLFLILNTSNEWICTAKKLKHPICSNSQTQSFKCKDILII